MNFGDILKAPLGLPAVLGFGKNKNIPQYGGMLKFQPGVATEGINQPDKMDFGKEFGSDVYSAKDYSGPLEEFKQLRNDTMSQASTAKDAGLGALERKFAAMGNLNSGAYTTASDVAARGYDQNASKAMNDIGFQEAQARRALQQGEDNKVFQSREGFNKEKRAYGTNFDQNKLENSVKMRSLDLALHKANQESVDNQFNAEMAGYQAEHSGGLFGSGGFLGLGL